MEPDDASMLFLKLLAKEKYFFSITMFCFGSCFMKHHHGIIPQFFGEFGIVSKIRGSNCPTIPSEKVLTRNLLV